MRLFIDNSTNHSVAPALKAGTTTNRAGMAWQKGLQMNIKAIAASLCAAILVFSSAAPAFARVPKPPAIPARPLLTPVGPNSFKVVNPATGREELRIVPSATSALHHPETLTVGQSKAITLRNVIYAGRLQIRASRGLKVVFTMPEGWQNTPNVTQTENFRSISKIEKSGVFGSSFSYFVTATAAVAGSKDAVVETELYCCGTRIGEQFPFFVNELPQGPLVGADVYASMQGPMPGDAWHDRQKPQTSLQSADAFAHATIGTHTIGGLIGLSGSLPDANFMAGRQVSGKSVGADFGGYVAHNQGPFRMRNELWLTVQPDASQSYGAGLTYSDRLMMQYGWLKASGMANLSGPRVFGDGELELTLLNSRDQLVSLGVYVGGQVAVALQTFQVPAIVVGTDGKETLTTSTYSPGQYIAMPKVGIKIHWNSATSPLSVVGGLGLGYNLANGAYGLGSVEFRTSPDIDLLAVGQN